MLGVAAVAGALFVAGCGDSSSGSDASSAAPATSASSTSASTGGAPVELHFASWVPNIRNAVDLFNRTHSDIHVTLDEMTAGPDGGYAKLLASERAGNAPDVAQVGYDELPAFLVAGALQDVTQYAQDSESKFVPWQWRQGVFGGKVYAIPQASGPMAFYYRKDLFDRLGLKAPRTWSEFAADAAKIRAKGASIVTFPPNQAPMFLGLAQQAGQQWFTARDDAWDVTVDNPDTMRMASFWQDLVSRRLVVTEPDMATGWYKDLQTGRVVGWIGASWGDALLRQGAPKTAGKWRVANLPQWADDGRVVSASWGGGSASAILRGTQHPEQATEFAVWLNSNLDSVNTLLTDGYGWPAVADPSTVRSLKDDPTVFKFYGGQNIWDVFATADAGVDTSWAWPPTTDQLYATVTDQLKKAVTGGSIPDAVTQIQQQSVAQLKAKGLSVAGG
jgi:multiple sugar transport system substrate-binding protein